MDGTEATLDAEHETPVRPERSAETEAAILDAARDILAEGGARSLSMRVVAERVGVSATALYRYFDGRDDLVRRVVQGGYRRFSEYMNDAIAELPVGSVERVLALGEAYLQFALENREYFKVWFSLQGESPKAFEELPEGGGYHILRQCVQDAITAGTIHDGNPDFVAHYVWTCAHGLVTLAMAYNLEERDRTCPGVPESPVELFRAFGPMIRNGLCGPEGSEQTGREFRTNNESRES